MKLHFTKTTDKIVGALRVSDKVFERVQKLAKENGVSQQEVIRAILERVIDDIE